MRDVLQAGDHDFIILGTSLADSEGRFLWPLSVGQVLLEEKGGHDFGGFRRGYK